MEVQPDTCTLGEGCGWGLGQPVRLREEGVKRKACLGYGFPLPKDSLYCPKCSFALSETVRVERLRSSWRSGEED